MLDGNAQGYELVNEPRQVEHGIILAYRDEVVVFRIFFSYACRQRVVGADSLLHVVQAKVAGHMNRAFSVHAEAEHAARTAHADIYVYAATPHLGRLQRPRSKRRQGRTRRLSRLLSDPPSLSSTVQDCTYCQLHETAKSAALPHQCGCTGMGGTILRAAKLRIIFHTSIKFV